MIQAVKAHTDSAGNLHATIEAAQTAEVKILLDANTNPSDLAGYIVENADKFVDILTTTESSRPAARKVNGGKKTRRPKATAAAEVVAAAAPLTPS
jgi:hypothetical protein